MLALQAVARCSWGTHPGPAAPVCRSAQEHAAEFGTDTQLGGYRSTLGKR